jgi:nicotinamide-nucleotide amidase
MRAEIIATGTELLSGTLDTNSIFISEELMLIGIETAFKTVVGDNERDMEEALRIALTRVDVVIVTGGLGPTEDDVTREAVSAVLKRRLIPDEEALKSIRAFFISRGREYIPANDKQALVPEGGILLLNPVGVAPGFIIDSGACSLAVLPGVPREMKAMFSDELRPRLAGRFGGDMFIRRRIIRTCGIFESAINRTLEDLLKRDQPVIGLSAKETGVDIRILAHAGGADQVSEMIAETEAEIRSRLGNLIYGVDGIEMEEAVGSLLKERGLRIALAESCTAGLIARRLTNIAGSSQYFERGAITYSNLSKHEMLGVPLELLERYGAVSSEVAAAMASGILSSAHADLGLAVTGIAGPEGGSEAKPVGLVYVALASTQGVKTEEHRLLGGREQTRLRASQMALEMVRRHLIGA